MIMYSDNGVRNANILDGTWPTPEQPNYRSLVGRLENIVQLERWGRYQAAATLREQTIAALAKQEEDGRVDGALLAALKGLDPLGPMIAQLRAFGY